MGTAKQVIPTENKGFQGPAGVPQRNALVQIKPRLDFSMETENRKIPKENKESRGPGGVPQRNRLVQIEPRMDLSLSLIHI